MNNWNRAVITFGNSGACIRTLREIRDREKLEPLHISYGHSLAGFEKYFLKIDKGHELQQIESCLQFRKLKLVGAINRVDLYIKLHSQITTYFNLPGPNQRSAGIFRDKSEFHQIHAEAGLLKLRPNSKIAPLKKVKTVVKEKYPIILKPNIGAKSRGIYKVTKPEDLGVGLENIQNHLSTAEIKLASNVQPMVLIEEVITGKQITITCFVDHMGDLKVLDFVEVINGLDLGLNHLQLVYRTNNLNISASVKQKILKYLRTIIRYSGLKSTFIHPEFMVSDERFWVIEINVRIGGFRTKMAKFAYGVDLDSMAIQLALGKDVSFEKKFEKSVTAVEVWEDKSGVIKRIDASDDSRIKELKLKIKVGDNYIAPPQAQTPLAQFYVVTEENSLVIAKMLRQSFRVEFY